MSQRGYPVGDFDQQARDVSVDHAHVVSEYHAAHQISLLNARGQATTEQLREAMVHYRTLFDDLLDSRDGQPT
jgi:dephospho-CoA kinase